MTTGAEITLPTSWVAAHLDSIAEVRLGRQRSPARAIGDHMRPYLRAANVTWKGLDLSDVKEMDFRPSEQEIYELRPGDILLAEASGSANEVGKPAIWNGEIEGCCFQNTLLRVRAPREMTKYLYYHFLSDATLGRFGRRARGVGIHHLGAEGLSTWTVRIAPLAEQHRIVAAIETHLTRLDAAVAALQRAHANLKRYHNAILKAAVEGRLVPTEAEIARAEGRGFEPAADLLSEISRQPGHSSRGTQLRLEGLGISPDQPREETAGLPGFGSLPQGWGWARLSEIAELKGGITKGQKRRLGERLRAVPYLRVANVQRGFLDLSDMRKIDAAEAEIAQLRLVPGDVLFTEGGDRDKLGRGWIWQGEIEECIHQNHIFRARLRSPKIQPKFVSWYGNSFGQRYFMKEGKQITNLASINITKLSALPVPIPPASEQLRIVSEVERQLSIFDGLETAVSHALTRAERMRQSILKRAFEGKLVSQDPSDESAANLLERARLARASASAVKRPARGTRMKQQPVQQRSLVDLLGQAPDGLTPEDLFEQSGHSDESVDRFYAELKREIDDGRVSEKRSGTSIILLRRADR